MKISMGLLLHPRHPYVRRTNMYKRPAIGKKICSIFFVVHFDKKEPQLLIGTYSFNFVRNASNPTTGLQSILTNYAVGLFMEAHAKLAILSRLLRF